MPKGFMTCAEGGSTSRTPPGHLPNGTLDPSAQATRDCYDACGTRPRTGGSAREEGGSHVGLSWDQLPADRCAPGFPPYVPKVPFGSKEC